MASTATYLRIALAMLLTCFFTACVGEDVPQGPDRVAPGDPLPEFEVVMNDGRTVSPATLAGRPAMIVFFNTECPDCRRELPVVERFSGLRPGVAVVCVAREEDAASIAAYWAANGLTLLWSAQNDRRVFELFAESGIPRIFTVGPDGIVTRSFSDTDAPSLDELLEIFPASGHSDM